MDNNLENRVSALEYILSQIAESEYLDELKDKYDGKQGKDVVVNIIPSRDISFKTRSLLSSILDRLELTNQDRIDLEKYIKYGEKPNITISQCEIEHITHDRLLLLKENEELKPGTLYRITDYELIIPEHLSESVRSANHHFDIIVLALSINSISEEACAVYNENDDYFKDNNSNLSAWKIWYSLENDTNKFAWADENGKGVIYRMIDEHGNDCPYDFKNVQYLRNIIYDYSEGLFDINFDDGEDKTYLYTFSSIADNRDIKDASVCYEDSIIYAKNNIIKESYFDDDNGIDSLLHLPDITFHLTVNDIFCGFHNNYIGSSRRNIFGESSYNKFESWVINNKIKRGSCYNNFGDYVVDNIIGMDFSYNTIKSNFEGNNIDNGCSLNIIGSEFSFNFIGYQFQQNNIGDCFMANTIGLRFHDNIIENHFTDNTLSDHNDTIHDIHDCYFSSAADCLFYYDHDFDEYDEIYNVHIGKGFHTETIDVDTRGGQYTTYIEKTSNGDQKIFVLGDVRTS